jgi:hypothetical protein
MAEYLPEGVRRLPRPEDLGIATPIGVVGGAAQGLATEAVALGMNLQVLDNWYAADADNTAVSLTLPLADPMTNLQTAVLAVTDRELSKRNPPPTLFPIFERHAELKTEIGLCGGNNSLEDDLLDELARGLVREC